MCTKNYWNRTTIVEIIVGGWVVTHAKSVCAGVCVCVRVCVCVCVCRCNEQVDVCMVNTRRLQMADFDSALYLLNSSQADALGAPKVYLSLFITVIYTILLPIKLAVDF